MNELNIAVLIGTVFASTGFWQFATTVWQGKNKKESAEKKALKVLLHDRLYQSCTSYISKGCIDVDGFDNIAALYGAYHELGGNGTGTELYNRCRALPLRENIDEDTEA